MSKCAEGLSSGQFRRTATLRANATEPAGLLRSPHAVAELDRLTNAIHALTLLKPPSFDLGEQGGRPGRRLAAPAGPPAPTETPVQAGPEFDLNKLRVAIHPYEPGPIALLPDRAGLLVMVHEPAARWTAPAEPPVAEADAEEPPETPMFAFLDTDDQATIDRITTSLDQLAHVLGYERPRVVEVQRGSFIRRSQAHLRRGLSSAEVRELLAKFEQALTLVGVEARQADVDLKASQAIANLVNGLKDLDRAVLNGGSILLIKYTNAQGPIILTRTLSHLERQALERYPEIQLHPETMLQTLATAVDTLRGP